MGRLLEWGLGLFVPEATKRGASLSEICTLTPFSPELELLAPLWEV